MSEVVESVALEPLGSDEQPRAPRSRTARQAAIVVGMVVLGLIFVLAVGGGGDQVAPSPLLGERAPALDGPVIYPGDPDQQSFDIDEWRGSWVVVNFFATWCPPCVAEHPEFVEFSRWGRDRGDVELVSVVFNDPEERVREFFVQRGGDWPVMTSAGAAIEFQVAQVPETFLVAPSGRVVAHLRGGTTTQELVSLIEGGN